MLYRLKKGRENKNKTLKEKLDNQLYIYSKIWIINLKNKKCKLKIIFKKIKVCNKKQNK